MVFKCPSLCMKKQTNKINIILKNKVQFILINIHMNYAINKMLPEKQEPSFPHLGNSMRCMF